MEMVTKPTELSCFEKKGMLQDVIIIPSAPENSKE
jgi:hypothetical protein